MAYVTGLVTVHFQDHISYAPASVKGLLHDHTAHFALVVDQVDACGRLQAGRGSLPSRVLGSSSIRIMTLVIKPTAGCQRQMLDATPQALLASASACNS